MTWTRFRFAVLLMMLLCTALVLAPAVSQDAKIDNPAELRQKADKLNNDGNYNDAYDLYRRLALSEHIKPGPGGSDLEKAIACLQRLNRVDEVDPLRQRVIETHKANPQLLYTAARTFFHGQHYGYMIAGSFERGHHRGGGRYVYSYERDRVAALQLMQRAFRAEGADKALKGEFYFDLAQMLMGWQGFRQGWRLQVLTDLTELPDFDENYNSYYYAGIGRGAPVTAEGKPVYYDTPKSWEAAKSDGERWRWALLQAAELGQKARARLHFADFLQSQFGVQTLAQYGNVFGRPAVEEDDNKETGIFEVHTLKDNETIAKLATGVRRFEMPDEFNFIKIYKELAASADEGQRGYYETAKTHVCTIYENRRQYPKAAECWRENIRMFGDRNNNKQQRLQQIIGNWGHFEPVPTQAATPGNTIMYRFRNGTEVTFTAHRIEVETLLSDVKEYIKKKPRRLDWNKLNIGNLGHRLIDRNEQKYIGREVARWTVELTPRSNHFDKRITVATPLADAGAYLLTGQMKDGNTVKVVMWVADTVIIKKPLAGKMMYYVADARTGEPVAKANVEFFGYQQQWKKNDRYEITTENFAEFTDDSGMLILGDDRVTHNKNWLIMARKGDRLAWLGFTGVWYPRKQDQYYHAVKTYVMTDRPVYRPGQPVHFKFWVNRTQYDQDGKSPFAGHTFTVRINDPRGQKVFEKQLTADEFGGFNSTFEVPDGATLGNYHVYLPHAPHGGNSFRVEEYKKPEFEVTVEAPDKPVMLGEKIDATIRAKYYFGAPVTHATVTYKVTRTTHDTRWFPPCPWDWLYGPGYWWFSPEYTWYPGWDRWGMEAPVRHWWGHWWPREQPEVVAEGEVEIGPDGTVKVPIDTALAKAVYGDKDHKYTVTAEVTDQSRRTIVGTGQVLAARKPFQVYVWVDRGWYTVGDVMNVSARAQTLDGKPVSGTGKLVLYRVTYNKDNKPVENAVQEWDVKLGEDGTVTQKMTADKPGQYRVSLTVTDAEKHTIEGGYLLTVRGERFTGGDFRYNHLELIPDKREYAPGDEVKLMLNTNRTGAVVLLFEKPVGGVYREPRMLRLKGKSTMERMKILKRDMPNCFVEAVTVYDGDVYTQVREIVVPPEDRVLKVEVTPDKKEYKPGEKAKVTVKLTEANGEPFNGSLVMTMYDKSVEYISGGSNVPDIKAFHWTWRRHHNVSQQHTLNRTGGNHNIGQGMRYIGVFGQMIPQPTDGERQFAQNAEPEAADAALGGFAEKQSGRGGGPAADSDRLRRKSADKAGAPAEEPGDGMAETTVRTKFADTAFWSGTLATDKNGQAEVEITMPENLTTWKTTVWAMGPGARCGQGTAEAVTTKNLIVRLQAPRFFVQKDEVVLSANIHNYLDAAKTVTAVLELEGPCLVPVGGKAAGDDGVIRLTRKLQIDAQGEQRVDWRVKVVQPGTAIIRMKGLTDQESDAMQMTFPVLVHGILKTESWTGVVLPEVMKNTVVVRVPAERRPEQTELTVRFSPSLAMAMVDALPYLVEYPHGCTEQTLNRFVPTVITQKILREMELDLEAIKTKRANLNAQELGDPAERAKQWKRFDRNPVFDREEVTRMVKSGLDKLTNMQNADGGWGWFSGWGEHSYPHTTAVVVHGLQVARANDVAIVPGVLERGIQWLENYQARQIQLLKNAEKDPKVKPWKSHADNLDALVYTVLVDEKKDNAEMRGYLYRDRTKLSVYAKAMFGLALHKGGHHEQRDMLKRNVEQYLQQDDENQSAWLKLPNGGWWWCWYGSEIEAHAWYLKLLAATEPKSEKASRLVKYLVNNRKHATYWNSTRDTAYAIEALADYIRAAGQDKPEMTVTVLVDGKEHARVEVTPENLFTIDNTVVLKGTDVTDGKHTIEVRRTGKGRLYWNAYLTNFTMEDPITHAGLEIKVRRRFYKLVEVDKTVKAEGAHGQAVDKKVEKYERKPLANLDELKSGDLLEVELVIESKNDYEYILFEDLKAAGTEPVQVRSGYTGNEMGAYVEFRDQRVVFFVRQLARGRHSVSYRLRAEIPGRFSALPTKASAMYAPELKANSDEFKLKIVD